MPRKWMIVVAAFLALCLSLVAAAWMILARYDTNSLKPKIREAVLAATGRELSISGDMRLHVGLAPRLTVDGVALANAPWGSRPEMVRIKSLAVTVSLFPLLRGRLDVRELTLVEPVILLETDRDGRPNFDFSEGVKLKAPQQNQPSGNDFLGNIHVRSARLVKASLDIQAGTSGRSHHLLLDDARLTAAPGGRLSWDVLGSYNGMAFSLTAGTGSLANLMQREIPFPVKAKLDFAGVTAYLEGSVTGIFHQPKMNLALTASGKDLKGLARLAGMEAPPPPGPFSVSLRLANQGPKAYEISGLLLKMADSDLSGSLSADLSGKRPLLKGELSSESLDLRPLVGTGKKNPGRFQSKRLFPDSPLPVSAWSSLDAGLTFRAKALRMSDLVFRDLSVKIALKDGGLRVPELSASLFGGTFDAALALSPEGRAVRADLTLEVQRMNLAAMLRELGSQGKLSGTVDFSADLSGRGDSVAAIMGGVNGITVLTGDHAAIGSRYLGLLGQDFANSLVRLLNPFKKSPDVTPVSCLVSGFSITNGKARTTALLLDLPENLVVGEGEINLKTEALDMSIKSIPKQGLGTKGTGKITMNLGKLAEPFRLSGTLSRPRLGVDVSETAYLVGKSLGGMALFGPVGVLSALLGTNREGKDPCRVAEEAARKGAVSPQEKGMMQKSAGALKKGLKSLEHGIGDLFNR